VAVPKQGGGGKSWSCRRKGRAGSLGVRENALLVERTGDWARR